VIYGRDTNIMKYMYKILFVCEQYKIWLWCKTFEYISDNFSRQNIDFSNKFFIKTV